MKQLIVSLVFLVLIFSGQSQVFEWAKCDSFAGSNRVVRSQIGSIYVVNNQGISKYDSLGNRIWAKAIIGTDCMIRGIDADSADNLYVTCAFGGTITIDSLSLSSTAGGNSNMLLVKVSPSGILQWVSRSISNGDSGSDGLTIDSDGYPIVIGRFLDSLKLGTFAFDAPLTNQVYLAKYSPIDGTCLWAKHLISESFNGGYNGPEIKSDGLGDTYISGHFIGNLQFDSLTYSPTPYTEWIFLTKIDENGNFLWLKVIDGSYQEISGPMDVDDIGNIYLSGYFDLPQANFGCTTLTISSPSYFTASYDSDGNCRWAKLGNADVICASEDGYYVNSPGFITKYNSAGNLLWTKTVPDASNNAMTSNGGDVYITGSFTGNVNFDTCALSSSSSRMYIAKLSAPLTTSIIETTENPGIVVYPNPASSSITISCPEVTGNYRLRITSISGKTVFKDFGRQNGFFLKEIDLKNLAKGIYFIELTSDGSLKPMTTKIILQ